MVAQTAEPAPLAADAQAGSGMRHRVRTPPAGADKPLTSYTWSEVAKHKTADDAWIVIQGKVYNVTKWLDRHPGGSEVIEKFAGADATDQFAAFHRPRTHKWLKGFLIGELQPSEGDAQAAGLGITPKYAGADEEYRALRERLWEQGYFNASKSYSAIKVAVWVAFLLAGVGLVLGLPDTDDMFTLRTLGGGILLGLGLQQAAFLAHDAMHNGVHEPKRGGGINWFGWFHGAPIFGISSRMWMVEHSLHHAITLRPREDPQFNYLPLWLISTKEIAGKKGRAFLKTLEGVLAKALVPFQHWTFLPLVVLIGRFNLHAISVVYALKHTATAKSWQQAKNPLMDLVGMGMYWAWLGLLLSQFSSTPARMVFLLSAYWTAGILHVQLLLSHLFTETLDEKEEREAGFFAFQLKTSRNIDSEWYDHWFHGGLEYQIEHHLFPQLPRHHLEYVKPYVQEIAKRHDLPYRSVPFTKAIWDILKDFKALSTAIVELDGLM